jgi:hypothetical protein
VLNFLAPSEGAPPTAARKMRSIQIQSLPVVACGSGVSFGFFLVNCLRITTLFFGHILVAAKDCRIVSFLKLTTQAFQKRVKKSLILIGTNPWLCGVWLIRLLVYAEARGLNITCDGLGS